MWGLNKEILIALDEAIACGDVESYEQIKKEYWVIDIYDYQNMIKN